MSRMTTEEAQRHNASRMSDKELRRELYAAESKPEQPYVRVRWIEVLREELARREARGPEEAERGT